MKPMKYAYVIEKAADGSYSATFVARLDPDDGHCVWSVRTGSLVVHPIAVDSHGDDRGTTFLVRLPRSRR